MKGIIMLDVLNVALIIIGSSLLSGAVGDWKVGVGISFICLAFYKKSE
jgi:hypothetical protein